MRVVLAPGCGLPPHRARPFARPAPAPTPPPGPVAVVGPLPRETLRPGCLGPLYASAALPPARLLGAAKRAPPRPAAGCAAAAAPPGRRGREGRGRQRARRWTRGGGGLWVGVARCCPPTALSPPGTQVVVMPRDVARAGSTWPAAASRAGSTGPPRTPGRGEAARERACSRPERHRAAQLGAAAAGRPVAAVPETVTSGRTKKRWSAFRSDLSMRWQRACHNPLLASAPRLSSLSLAPVPSSYIGLV